MHQRVAGHMQKVLLMVLAGAMSGAGSIGVVTAGASSLWKTFGAGMYRVGKDVPAGTYRSLGGSNCYWARLRSFSGDLNAIIANANPRGPALATIKRTDKGFETSGCAKWTNHIVRITKSKTRFAQGEFIVRLDVAPSTYGSRGGSNCYWSRLRAFTGDLGAIIANGNPRGRAIVTIKRTDKGFESQGCGTWTRF